MSWVIIYITPSIYITYYYSIASVDLVVQGIIYLLALICIYNTYEIGYIQNDADAIKSEENPTLRLSATELLFYGANKGIIWTCRALISVGVLVALYTVIGESKTGFLIFLALLIVMLGVFLIYNVNFGKWKIILHFILVCIRFMSFPFLLNPRAYLQPSFWLLIIIFPLPNLIERSSEEKFNVPFIKNIIGDRRNIDNFRFYYYLFTATFVVFLSFSDRQYLSIGFLAIYFLCYRFMIFLKLFSFTKVRQYDDARKIG